MAFMNIAPKARPAAAGGQRVRGPMASGPTGRPAPAPPAARGKKPVRGNIGRMLREKLG